MKSLPRSTVLLAVAALAACAEPPAGPASDDRSLSDLPVAAAAAAHEWVPVDLVVQKCGGPAVHVTGRRHVTRRLSFDATGGLHRGLHMDLRLTGRAADGTRYSYSGVQNSQIYFANPPFTDVTELRLRMIAQGDAEDFIQVFRYHETIQANGEITSSFTAASEECGDGASGGTPA